MSTPTPTPATPATILTFLVKTLITTIGFHLYQRAIRIPGTTLTDAASKAAGLAQSYLQTLARRFAKLEARYLAGTLVNRPRPSRAGAPRATRKPGRFASIPRRWGWLVREIPDCAWTGAGAIGELLHRPETLAMIAAFPTQTGRILRPLARLLLPRDSLPLILRPPPRPPRPRAPKPPDPLAAARAASSYPDHLRTPRHRLGATWTGPGRIFYPPRKSPLKNET